MDLVVTSTRDAEKSRRGNVCSPGWLHSPLVCSLTFLYVCWFCSTTGNPIIIVIVVIIIITTQVGAQKLTSGKLRREDCFVLLVFLVAYFYDRSVFQQMLSSCLLYLKRVNKAVNHHLPYSAFWACQIVLEGSWAEKQRASVLPQALPQGCCPSVPFPSGRFVKRRRRTPWQTHVCPRVLWPCRSWPVPCLSGHSLAPSWPGWGWLSP